MKKIYQTLLLSCFALIALNAKAQNPTFGSYIGKDVALYREGTAGGNTNDPANAATLDFKVVTVDNKTWAKTSLSNGVIGGDDAWVSQLRFWNSNDAGKRENTLTIRPSATESLGSTVVVPDADGKISIFQNLTTGGFNETTLLSYNPATANTPVANDATAPTLTTCVAENVNQVSALLRFVVTEDNDYFYYITGAGFAEVAFADSLPLSGLTSGASYTYTVTAVDFSGNASATQDITFTTSSAVTLATPDNISISDDSVISFTGDNNALKYTVTVYRGATALVDHTQDVSAATGEKLNFGIPGTYTVTVQAMGNELDIVSSPVSAGYTWNLVNDSYTPPVAASSNNCRQPLTNSGVEVWLTVEEKNGQLWVTLEPSTESDKESRFRAAGFRADAFTLNGKTGTWFTKEDGDRQQVFTPTVSLHAGDVINYNGIIEWIVPGNNNAYEPDFTLDRIGGGYTWGSHCPRLAAPANIAIDADRRLTFSGDADASHYAVKIYNDAGLLACEQGVSSGDVLPFDIPGTFTVVMQSLADPADKEHFDSDTSLHYTWQLKNSGRITYLSGFLNTEVGTGNGRALWTWETVDTIVIISIAAIEGKEPTNFRNTNGLNPELFTVNGVSNTGQTFFTATNTNTTVTLTPVAGAVKLGDVVSYSGMVTYQTADDGNLWPTINFGNYGLFVYGAKGLTLFPPENISVDADRVLTFDGDAAAGSYEVKIYNGANLPVATQVVPASGETLLYDAPGSYTLTLQSLAASPERNNSVASKPYAWNYAGADEVRYPSTFCGFEVNPVGRDDRDKAVFTWETRDGKLVITISNADGNFDTYFRNAGLQIGTAPYNFKVNGVAGDWFNAGVPNGNIDGYTQITYEPKQAISFGDQITFNGTVEYRTGLQVINNVPEGLWPTIDFGAFGAFTWGTTCDYYPQVSVDKSQLVFSPDTGIQSFQLSAEKLTSPLIIETSKGLKASLATIAPNAEGKVYATVVNVTWEEGSSSGFVRVRGGGLAFPKEIPVVSHRFSEYCNKTLYSQAGDAPIYLTIAESPDKTALSFTLAPVYGASAQWNNIANITSSGSQTLNNKTPNGSSTITATFDAPLADEDVVTFGDALVWTAAKANGTIDNNAFIDALQTYTVGAGGCLLDTPHPAVYPEVTSATAKDRAVTTATLKIATNETAATYAISAVRLREVNDLLPLQELAFSADSLYTLENLDTATAYSLEVTAVDEKGYASALQTLSFATRSVPTLDSFEYEALKNLTYDGAEHPVEVTAKAGIAAGIGAIAVKYNASDAVPVSAGDYAVTLEVAQGEDFVAGTFDLGNFTIAKAFLAADSLAYDTTAVTYDGIEHAVAVFPKPTTVGLGSITVKYDGNTSAPIGAGSYVVTVDIGEGNNYFAATDLRLGTLVIDKANVSADNLNFTSKEVTYDGAPQAATVSVKEDLRGVGSISLLYNGSGTAPTNAGKYGITVNLGAGDNYLAGSVALPDSFAISKATLEATHLSYTPKSVQYDGNTHEVSVSLIASYTGVGEITVKYNGSETLPSELGTYAVTVSVAEGGNFSATAGDIALGNFVISDKALVTLADLDYTVADVTYDGNSHAVSVTAKGVVLGDISVLYNDSEAVPVNAGRYVVKVEVAENGEYALTELELPDTLVIRKATLAAEFFSYTPQSVQYNGSTHEVSVSLVAPYTGAGEITVKYNGSEAAPTEAGTYAVTVSVAEGGNFSATAGDIALGNFVISEKVQASVTLTDLDYTVADVTYDGNSHAVSVAAKPNVALGAISVLYNGSEAVPVNAGRYVVRVEVAETDGYALTELELPDTLVIRKAEPNASLLSYAISDSVEHDNASHAVAVAAKESVTGLGATTVKYNGSEAAPVGVGTYVVTVDVAEGDNYLAASLELGQFVIYAAPIEPPTAVEVSAASALSAYVANGVLHLIGEIEIVRVVNTGGSVVVSARVAGSSTLSVAHLPAGVYFVALQGKSAACVVKLQVVN